MAEHFWDTQIEYLKSTRTQMWNDDYFEFLVKSVWKLNSPKKIVDFGCGYGYLGAKLLPLLPEGSTYTGIDIGEKLLCEARNFYKDAKYCAEFIQSDLETYKPEKSYDIAICQAVLRHIPQSKAILKKMVDSVCNGGMVICIEVNRRMENAGIYIDGIEFDMTQNDVKLHEQWENELQRGGRDYRLGIKAPIYMEQAGLKNIGVRVNDFVEFISPLRAKDQYDERINSFFKENSIEHIKKGKLDMSALQARSLLISYGTRL